MRRFSIIAAALAILSAAAAPSQAFDAKTYLQQQTLSAK